MSFDTLAIPAGFIMLAALLCWFVIGTKGAWWKKLLAIVLVPGFGIAIWSSLASFRGWPSPSAPPHKAQFLWAEVHEPEPQKGDPGRIYVLLRPVGAVEKEGAEPFSYEAPRGMPRLYDLPYSRPMHQAVQAAMQMVREGKLVVLEGGGSGGGHGPPGNGSGGPGGQGDGGGFGGRQDPQVYELPPPHPPEKRQE